MTLLHACTTNLPMLTLVKSLKMMKDSVFCLVNVLFFVTYWNIYTCIYIVQIAKRHTSPVFAFNTMMQTRPNILPDLVFACLKPTQDFVLY